MIIIWSENWNRCDNCLWIEYVYLKNYSVPLKCCKYYYVLLYSRCSQLPSVNFQVFFFCSLLRFFSESVCVCVHAIVTHISRFSESDSERETSRNCFRHLAMWWLYLCMCALVYISESILKEYIMSLNWPSNIICAYLFRQRLVHLDQTVLGIQRLMLQ